MPETKTALLYYDHEEGRHRLAVTTGLSPDGLLDILVAWSGQMSRSAFAALSDRERHQLWWLFFATHGEFLDLGEWDGPLDVPPLPFYCSGCKRADHLPRYVAYGEFGEPLAYCEDCHVTTLLARAKAAGYYVGSVGEYDYQVVTEAAGI